MKIRRRAVLLGVGLSVLVAAGTARAQCTGCPRASFVAPRSFPVSPGAYAVVSADFDRDGRPDVATYSGGFPPVVSVFLGRPDTVLDPPTTYPIGPGSFSPFGLASGDFDGDGKQDLIITVGTASVSLMRGNGDGSFQNAVQIATSKVNNEIALGDFNGDGNLDFATTDSFDGALNVNIYYGDGAAHFSAPITIPVGPGGVELQSADFNGDGKAEILLINRNSNSISVILGIGVGPVAPARDYPVGFNPQGLAIGDWNSDGFLDVAVTNSEHLLTILLGSGAAQFQPPIFVSLPGFGGRLVSGDFDGDGKQDLIALGTSYMALATGNGAGNFATPRNVGATPNRPVVSDINRDGASDLIGTTSQSLVIYTGAAQERQLFAETYPSVPTAALGVGDFNSDGKPDIVVFSPFGGITMLLSNSTGYSSEGLSLQGGSVGTVADTNSDGRPDLLVVTGDRLLVYLGAGGTAFLSPQSSDLGSVPDAIAVTDLNRDGIRDVVTANGATNSITVLLGRGDGTFGSSVQYAVGSRPLSIAIGDFNRDGIPDVSVANDGGTIALLLSDGSGGFSSISSFPSGISPKALVAIDYDGNGKVGVAFLTTSSRNVLTLMKGDGTGQLSAPVNIALGMSAASIASLDFDRDGLPDLAVGGSPIFGTNGYDVVFLHNLGSATFAESTRYFVGAASALLAVDLDGDGLDDLIAGQTGFSPSAVEVLRNTNCLPRSLSVAIEMTGCQVPGTALSPQPVIHLLDDGSNLVTCDPGPVTASIVPATGTPGAVLGGTLSVSSAGGVATFSDLSVNLPGSAYRLEFRHPQGGRTRSRSFSQGLSATIAGPSAVCGPTASWDSASPFETYLWTLDGVAVGKGRRLSRAGLTAGTHTLSLTVGQDGCTATDSRSFTVSSPPSGVVTAPLTVREKSAGNSASVPDAGPGATYVWIISRGTITAGQGTRTITFTAGTGGSVVLSVGLATGTGCTAFGSVTVLIVTSDFNANGQTDLLWRNGSTGENVVWLMNGLVVSSLAAPPSVFDLNWKIGGVADFDSDGQPDILWRNTADGRNVVWLMNGTSVASQPLLPSMTDQNWQIAGVADFDGDEKPDIVWRNGSTGENLVWLMSGTGLKSIAPLPTIPDPNWRIGGTGDLDGDGRPDIVWRNSGSGQDTIWLMNGTSIASQMPLPAVADVNWQISAVADLDGDGKADLVWRHAVSGANTVWRMNGTVVSSTAPLPQVSDPAWKLVGPR